MPLSLTEFSVSLGRVTLKVYAVKLSSSSLSVTLSTIALVPKGIPSSTAFSPFSTETTRASFSIPVYSAETEYFSLSNDTESSIVRLSVS